MRYDDPQRPSSLLSAVNTPLQTNGSPLPTITLMYPMQNGAVRCRCTQQGPDGPQKILGCTGAEDTSCSACEVEDDPHWGWLACVHAHRASNRFGTYYGWLRDLGQFQADYLADPEAALLKYFKYAGPDWEPTAQSPRPTQEIQEEIF